MITKQAQRNAPFKVSALDSAVKVPLYLSRFCLFVIMCFVPFGLGMLQGGLAQVVPLVSAILSFGVSVVGVRYATRTIRGYATETNGLEQNSYPRLVWNSAKKLFDTREFDPDVPLLAARQREVLHAIHDGSSLPNAGNSMEEERFFAAPERNLRATMDIVLNLGIAGTFLSILLGFMDGQLNSNNLLTHVGPGLLSGLAAVSANIALRLSHSALLAEQDQLARAVDTAITKDISAIPTSVLSPQRHLAEAVESSLAAQNKTIKDTIEAQNKTVKDTIDAQNKTIKDNIDAQNRAIAGSIAHVSAKIEEHTASVRAELVAHSKQVTNDVLRQLLVLTEKVSDRMESNSKALLILLEEKLIEPVTQVSESAIALSASVGTLSATLQKMEAQGRAWGETVATMQTAQTSFLLRQAELVTAQQTAHSSFVEEQKRLLIAQGEASIAYQQDLKELSAAHQEAVVQQFAEYRHSLEALFAAMRTHQEQESDKTNRFHLMLVENNTRAVSQMLAMFAEYLKSEVNALFEQQKEHNQQQFEEALDKFGKSVTQTTEEIEGHIAKALQTFRDELPEHLKVSIEEALEGAVKLVGEVRSYAKTLGIGIDTLNQDAARHFKTIAEWSGRVQQWQDRMDRVVETGQETQNSLALQWQTAANASLKQLEEAFGQVANRMQQASLELETQLNDLTTRLNRLEAPSATLSASLNQATTPIADFQNALTNTIPQLASVGATLQGLQATSKAISDSLETVRDTEVQWVKARTANYEDLGRGVTLSTAHIKALNGEIPKVTLAGEQLSVVLQQVTAQSQALLDLLEQRIPPAPNSARNSPGKEIIKKPELVATKDGNSREVTPREATPREPTPREATPREATPREATPREATPREATPREATPREATPREATPREATPRDGRSRDERPRDGNPREGRLNDQAEQK